MEARVQSPTTLAAVDSRDAQAASASGSDTGDEGGEGSGDAPGTGASYRCNTDDKDDGDPVRTPMHWSLVVLAVATPTASPPGSPEAAAGAMRLVAGARAQATVMRRSLPAPGDTAPRNLAALPVEGLRRCRLQG